MCELDHNLLANITRSCDIFIVLIGVK